MRARTQVGTSSFNLDSVPRNGGMCRSSMVNEGFGINQLVHMLTVCLYSKTKIVAIEEPEIHLHPSMVRKLVHTRWWTSPPSTTSGLSCPLTARPSCCHCWLRSPMGKSVWTMSPSYLLRKRTERAVFTKQEATQDGQIQGGLSSFIQPS